MKLFWYFNIYTNYGIDIRGLMFNGDVVVEALSTILITLLSISITYEKIQKLFFW